MSFECQMFWDQTMPLLRLVGAGSRAFLNGQTTVNFLEERPSSFVRGCWLNTSGRVRALFEARLIDEGAELLVLGGELDEVLKGFDQVIFPSDNVRLELGQDIRRVQPLFANSQDRFRNVEWFLPGKSLPEAFNALNPANPNDLALWRMEHGLPFGKDELNARNNPFELGLSNLVNLNKGCYLGQETIAKLLRAGQVRKQLRFWTSDSELLVGQGLTNSSTKSTTKKKIGEVTSVMRNKSTGSSFGLAMVRVQACSEKELYSIDNLSRLTIKVPIGFVDAYATSLE
tara:strand:- start:89 stop:946 length:858 start_codon:yes stop_codon:yes gene_type:complete